MTKFRKRGCRERMAQDFDREKITMKRAFGEINVYDFIQSGRDDTEVYPTLEKYGSIDRLKKDLTEEQQKALYQDFTIIQEMGDYRGVKDYQIKANKMFYELPLEIRKEFENDINKFTKNGAQWLKKKIEEAEAKKQAEAQAQAQTNNSTGEAQ